MFLLLPLLLVCDLVTLAVAFPRYVDPSLHAPAGARQHWARDDSVSATALPGVPVDVTGTHAYQDPLPGQARGPCPAQNALANHGYLDRSGFTNLAACIDANVAVFNMGQDFAGYLCFMGMLTGGDTTGVVFSIGNSSAFDSSVKQSCSSGGLLGPIFNIGCLASKVLSKVLGTPGFGMAQTHNSFEADSSFMSADWQTINGLDASSRDINAVQEFYSRMRPDGTFDDRNIFIDWASYRKNQGIATNPCYFRAPQATLFAALGAYSLAHRLFSNYTAARPDGTLTGSTLASFEGFTMQADKSVVSKPFGRERIPDNWYKRPTPYYIHDWFVEDYSKYYARDPTLSSIGGNTGGVNTFSGLSIGDLTGGVINSANLLDGDNFVCFYYRILQIDLLPKLPSAVGSVALGFGPTLGAVMDTVFGRMVRGPGGVAGCPKFQYSGVNGQKRYCGVSAQPGGVF